MRLGRERGGSDDKHPPLCNARKLGPLAQFARLIHAEMRIRAHVHIRITFCLDAFAFQNGEDRPYRAGIARDNLHISDQRHTKEYTPYEKIRAGVYNARMSHPTGVQKTALAITRSVGSPTSVIFHSILFLGSFALAFSGFIGFDRMLLILTTIVSLEAIYLAIFIQMTLNYTTEALRGVEEDIDEMQEDVEEIQGDIDEIQEDVEEISEDDDTDEGHKTALVNIQSHLRKLTDDISKLQK